MGNEFRVTYYIFITHHGGIVIALTFRLVRLFFSLVESFAHFNMKLGLGSNSIYNGFSNNRRPFAQPGKFVIIANNHKIAEYRQIIVYN